jgi:uncharacterized protein YuzE
MKLHYYPETDSLYIELKPVAGVETREIVSGLNVDLDSSGALWDWISIVHRGLSI